MVTDEDGRVTSRRDYTAFGEESVTPERAAGLGYAGTSETRKGYTGYEKDTESGLDFAQARYYNPTHGRFTSVDPLTASMNVKNPQTFNRYTYVLNSPYKFTDPLGLLPESESSCGFKCRVSNAINGNGKLSDADLELAKFHIRNGTALGYIFLNASHEQLNRQNTTSSTSQPDRRRTETGSSSAGTASRDGQSIVNISAFLADGRLTDSSILNTHPQFAYMLRSHAVAFMKAVLEIEEKIGRKLKFEDVFRPTYYQQELFDKYQGELEAYNSCWVRCSEPLYTDPPGMSTHQAAASFDLPFYSSNSFTPSEESIVIESFARAGFIRNVQKEAWHFTVKEYANLRENNPERLRRNIEIIQNRWKNAVNP